MYPAAREKGFFLHITLPSLCCRIHASMQIRLFIGNHVPVLLFGIVTHSGQLSEGIFDNSEIYYFYDYKYLFSFFLSILLFRNVPRIHTVQRTFLYRTIL